MSLVQALRIIGRMDTMQAIKGFLARLAGAPMAARAAGPGRIRSRRGTPSSGLYASPPIDPPPPSRTSKQRDGDAGEAFARRYLERAGLAFVAANVTYRDGEIDLIMRDRRVGSSAANALVFVEVRYRSHGSHGGAAASVTREKRRRIVAAASHYLVGLGLRTLPTCRFDVIALEGDAQQGFRVDWIRDAFRDDG